MSDMQPPFDGGAQSSSNSPNPGHRPGQQMGPGYPSGAQMPQPPQSPQLRPGYAMKPAKRPGGFGVGFGKGFGFALGIGVVMVVLSLLSFVMLLISVATMQDELNNDASMKLATVWGDDAAEGRLRAFYINGTIMAEASDGSVLGGGTYGYEIADMIRNLNKDDASGIVLLVNTPGGSISGSAAIADAVADYQERTGQKVLVHVSSMSASGGVYSTSTADEIWADEGALVGSIGVISGPFQRYTNVTAIGSTILQAGVTAEKIEQEYLSAGKGKAFGDPFNEMSKEQREQWLEGINASYDTFVQRMVQGRGMDATVIREEMGAGMFTGEKAVQYKLIDGTKGRDEFFRYAAEQAGLDPTNTKVETITDDAGLLRQALGVQRAYGHAPSVEQAQGVVPTMSQAICSPTAVLAYQGALNAVCG